MIDFTLRHGNDLLAVECLKGFVVCLYRLHFHFHDTLWGIGCV